MLKLAGYVLNSSLIDGESKVEIRILIHAVILKQKDMDMKSRKLLLLR